MDINTVRQKYIDFFVNKAKHKEIPPAPLIPSDDPTTLFTSSGMQQLVPYLKGEVHPMGNKLVNSQPCFRAEDIDEVGNTRHTTFFEMLGNWSLGDYFKKEQLSWFWEFLIKEVGLSKDKLHVTVFDGDKKNNLPKDEKAYKIWTDLGVNKDHIHYYDATKNWWSRAGTPDNMPAGEIGGPDSEVFYDFDPDLKLDIHNQSEFKNKKCHINCDCGRYLEIGNSVFMQYIKNDDGTFSSLPKQNVDFGGGLIRIVAATNNQTDIFKLDVFKPAIEIIEKELNVKYGQSSQKDKSIRIILDHTRAATMLISEGVIPGNKAENYILRKLIRRSVFHSYLLNQDSLTNSHLSKIADSFKQTYPKLGESLNSSILNEESIKFNKALNRGLKKLKKAINDNLLIDGKFAFDLYQTDGFPIDLTIEILEKETNQSLSKSDLGSFTQEFEKHKQLSRTASAGMFKGGLADNSEDVTRLHTATHLLHKALREVLGDHVRQEGSNITAQRLRFDYQHPDKPTLQQLQEIEKIINQKISEDLPVTKTIEDKEEALKSGAMAFFKETYPDKVSIYTIGNDSKKGWFSKEFCGGPHVASTGEIGTVTIKKDKSIGAGMRRIYVVLTTQNGNKKHSFKNQSNI